MSEGIKEREGRKMGREDRREGYGRERVERSERGRMKGRGRRERC